MSWLVYFGRIKGYTFSSNPFFANLAFAISIPPHVAQRPTKPITNSNTQNAMKKKHKNNITPNVITFNFEFSITKVKYNSI